MSDLLVRVVKAQRIDFIVKYMISSQLEGQKRYLLDEWLGELTEDLVTDLVAEGRSKAPVNKGLDN